MHRTNREARCPACQSLLTGATNAKGNDTTPEPGDLSVCAYCMIALTFNTDLTLRLLRAEEIDALPPDARFTLDQTQATAMIAALLRRSP